MPYLPALLLKLSLRVASCCWVVTCLYWDSRTIMAIETVELDITQKYSYDKHWTMRGFPLFFGLCAMFGRICLSLSVHDIKQSSTGQQRWWIAQQYYSKATPSSLPRGWPFVVPTQHSGPNNTKVPPGSGDCQPPKINISNSRVNHLWPIGELIRHHLQYNTTEQTLL